MNIVVDFGNTVAKVGIFRDEILEKIYFFNKAEELQSFLTNHEAENLLVSSVSHDPENILAWSRAAGKKLALTAGLSVPVHIAYATPATLGVDRIAAVCGALAYYPGDDCLVIDAGTCITYEFIDASGTYHGGGISPGVQMRFKAMHEFTARLPRVDAVDHPPLIGTSTETCLQSGVINGMIAEVTGTVSRYRGLYPDVRILLCGGDAPYFENPSIGIILVPELVLTGLNRILRHNLDA